jgi:hypothetical protein
VFADFLNGEGMQTAMDAGKVRRESISKQAGIGNADKYL